jgi:hypothetical protein
VRHANRALLLTVFVLSGGSGTSFGQAANSSEETACGTPGQPADSGIGRGQWTVAAYLGGVRTADSPLTISQPAPGNLLRFDDVRFEGRSLEDPFYYGFRAGYFLPQLRLGVETEFIHLKVYADTKRQVRASGIRLGVPIDRILTLDDIVEQYSISHGVNLLLFNGVGRYSIGLRNGRDRLVLAGRFGAGPSIPHTESTVDGHHQEQYEAGRLGWQLAGGIELHLWRGLHAFFEYKFTRTNQRGRVYLGQANSLLRSQHGILGLAYHFGGPGNRKP